MVAGTATVRESSAPRLIRDLARRKALPVAFLLVSVLLLLSRLPMSLVTNFWAEDGAVFYAQAYNLGSLQPLTRLHQVELGSSLHPSWSGGQVAVG